MGLCIVFAFAHARCRMLKLSRPEQPVPLSRIIYLETSDMAASSSQNSATRYSWEVPAFDWEDRGDPDSSDGENADPTPEEAASYLVQFLLDLLYANSISARSLCVICYWAAKAGAGAAVGAFGLKPNAPSGHFQRKIDQVLGVNLKASKESMYKVMVPQHTKYDLSRTTHPMVVRLPHECLAQEVQENPACVTGGVCDTASYKAHPVVRANAGTQVMPVALYLDGIPFTKRDSLLAVFVYSLVSYKRHLCAVLRRSHMCRCGCKGYCSLYPLLEALTYSFSAMAQGKWPTRRHDGPWGPGDSERSSKGGRPLGFVGAVLHVKGDWSEFAHTLGLSDWSSRLYCCFFCQTTRDTRFDLSGLNPLSNPWGAVTHADIERACSQCEVWRTLSAKQHALVMSRLYYEKKSRGGTGRCLSADIPELSLLKGDRLEPHPGLQDVGLFDRLGKFPTQVLFWRRACETRCRHRNPLLMAPALGLTINSLMVDKLHTLNLGAALFWCCHALWRLILVDAWGTSATSEQLHQLSALQIRNELWAWYREQRRAHPEREIAQVSDFNVRMLGKPNHQTLTTKAAETKWLVPFVLGLLRKYRGAFDSSEAGALIGSGASLQELFDIMETSPRELPPQVVQRLYDAAKKHIVLAKQAGVPLKPKHHLLLHMVSRAAEFGNPDAYSTFEDESINKLVKNIGEAAHRSVWEVRVLVQFDKVEEARAGFKRRREW